MVARRLVYSIPFSFPFNTHNCIVDDWPTSPSVTSPTQSSQSSASPAVWADLSSSMGGPSDWTASDPVMAGIASGMMSASIEKSSEC